MDKEEQLRREIQKVAEALAYEDYPLGTIFREERISPEEIEAILNKVDATE